MSRRGLRLPHAHRSDEWSLRYDRFDPAEEGHREALCTLGNGYVATRGAAPERSADGVHYPGTYVAGLYNRLSTEVSGQEIQNESIVNAPNWLATTYRIDGGAWFDLGEVDILDFAQELDLRAAILTRRVRFQDRNGRTTRLVQRRFVSMADRHVAGLRTTLTAENWSGRICVRSGLDGRVTNAGVGRYARFDGQHWDDTATRALDGDTVLLTARTSQSGVEIAEAARTRVRADGSRAHVDRVIEEAGCIFQEFDLDLQTMERITIDKIVSIHTSRDRPMSDPDTEACSTIGRLGSFTDLLRSHSREWQDLWKRFIIDVECAGETTRLALHLHLFHLLQTASRNTIDLDAGIPARGLHGEAYRGHIFWDELFVFPYLGFHLPELVRSLLLYRYRRLPEARWSAREAGYRGAMFPWQSGSNGREESQVLHLNPMSGRWISDASHLQRHINSAIVYNIWKYLQQSGDLEFMATYGAEMVLEIARFWASVAHYDPALERYEIRGVMGPDEYHDGYVGAHAPGLANNSYTNVMAVWVLCRALELPDLLHRHRWQELRAHLELEDEELERWEDISRKMRLVFHSDGILSQFEGYEELAELDWDGLRARYGDISRLDRVLEQQQETVNAYKASKQADVLMLYYLLSADELQAIFARLGYPIDGESIARTIDYYLQRTSHGSTLSRIVHSWVLARSDRERSWNLWEDALSSDLYDTQGGTTAEGVHLGAMAGTVDLLQRCYLGMEIRDDVLWFDPQLPAEITRLSLDIRYRRRWMNLSVVDGLFTVEADEWGEGTARIGLGGTVSELTPGERRQMAL